MTIKSRLKRLEALPVHAKIPMDSMAEFSPEQAEEIYNQVMKGPSPHLFARTRYGKVPFNELPDAECGRIYKETPTGILISSLRRRYESWQKIGHLVSYQGTS